MTAPHVGFIHGSNDLYGASRVLALDVEILTELGCSVTVVVPADGPLASKLPATARLVIDPGLAILRRSQPTSVVRVPRLPRALRSCDVVVVWTLACLAYLPAARLSRVLTIVAVHEILPQLAGRALARAVGLHRGPVVANSFATADWLGASGVRRDDITVAYPVAPSHACSATTSSGPLRVLMAGRVNDIKGHLEAVDHCEGARTTFGVDLTLTLAGSAFSGQEFRVAELERRIDGLDWASYVGETDGIRELLMCHDLLLVASTRPESFGLVVLEAWANGVRSVVPREGGVFEAGQMTEALTYAPRDGVSLAEVLRFAAAHASVRSSPSPQAPVATMCSRAARSAYWSRAIGNA